MRIRDGRPRRLAPAALAGAAPVRPRCPREAPDPRRRTPTRPRFSARLETAWQARDSRAGSASGISRPPSRGRSRRRPCVPPLRPTRRPSRSCAGRALPRAPRGSTPTSRSSWRPSRGRGSPTGASRVERRAAALGDRVAAGGGPGRRPGAPLAGAVGLARARGVAAARGLRAPDGGRDPLLDPRGRWARPPSPSWAAPVSASPRRRPPSASSSASSRARESIDREVGWAFMRLHPADFHRAIETGRLEPETGPGRAALRGAARVAGPLLAQLRRSTRRFPAPRGG